MVASSEAVTRALKDDKLINESELETRVENISKKILDETVNVFRVKKILQVMPGKQYSYC